LQRPGDKNVMMAMKKNSIAMSVRAVSIWYAQWR
jgi:hypothetical protein